MQFDALRQQIEKFSDFSIPLHFRIQNIRGLFPHK